MSDDRRIAPSPARERLAFAAGLRPRARWLCLGGLALLAGLSLRGGAAADLVRDLTQALGLGDPAALAAAPDLGAALDRLAAGTWAIAGLVLAVLLGVALGIGGLGPISGTAGRRLSLDRVDTRPAITLAAGVVVLGAAALALRGTVAGAARAAGASEAGLALLWSGTAAHVLVVIGLLLAAAGAAELVLSRVANRRALFRTEAQARADARRDGSRRH